MISRVAALCLSVLLLTACGEDDTQNQVKKQAKPGCSGITADRPIVAPRIWQQAREEGLVWAVILLQEPPVLEGGGVDQAAVKAIQDKVMDAMDVGPDEKVFAGKYVAAINMELDAGRLRLLESLPEVCSISSDRNFWPMD